MPVPLRSLRGRRRFGLTGIALKISNSIPSYAKGRVVHGTFFVELYKYAGKKLGSDKWSNLLENSAIGPKVYVTSAEYADQDMTDLISTIAEMTEDSVDAIWEDFGEFAGEDLARIYGALVEPEWGTLEVLENTGTIVPIVFRETKPDAELPQLHCTRLSPDKAVIVYDSSRKLCAFIKGVVKGIARHFNEKVLLKETSCMLDGSPNCEILVDLAT
jgi:hypothetical protein